MQFSFSAAEPPHILEQLREKIAATPCGAEIANRVVVAVTSTRSLLEQRDWCCAICRMSFGFGTFMACTTLARLNSDWDRKLIEEMELRKSFLAQVEFLEKLVESGLAKTQSQVAPTMPRASA